MVDMSVEAGGLILKNPLVIESAGYIVDGFGLRKMAKTGASAIITKSMTYKGFQGGPKPRCYWYNAEKREMNGDEALLNPGFRKAADFIRENKQFAKEQDCRVVASFSPRSIEEAEEEARTLQDAGADAVHMDLQCPTAGPFRDKQYPGESWDHLGSYWSQTPELVASVIKAVKKVVDIPVWPKPLMFRWNTDPAAIRTLDSAGADAYAYMHPGLPVLFIDVHSGRPTRGPVPGRKQGAIKLTSDLARMTDAALLPSGGFKNCNDVLQGMMAGAKMVGICTAVYANPGVIREILEELESYMELQQKLKIDEIVGSTLEFLPPMPGPESEFKNLFLTKYLRAPEGDYNWGWISSVERRKKMKQEAVPR